MKSKILWSGLCCALFAICCNANATSFTIGDSNALGFINYGIPTGDADITSYVNALIGLPLGGTTNVVVGPKTNVITRSFNFFGSLDPAVLASRTSYSSAGATVTIDLGTGYEYLFAKYDGPNYGSEVWYVGGLTGTITIPGFAEVVTVGKRGHLIVNDYGISAVALFTPDPVPDGGTTVVLLTSSLVALAMLRGFVCRQAQATEC